jgi:hypothetical protein
MRRNSSKALRGITGWSVDMIESMCAAMSL